MIPPFQETDTKLLTPSYYSVIYQMSNMTTGRDIYINYFPMPIGSDILRHAWELVYRLSNRQLADQSYNLINVIEKALIIIQQYQFDLSYIPQLQAKIIDENTVLFEFICQDFRIGFSIESNPQESGWYLVTNRKLGEVSYSGFLSAIDLNFLIMYLVQFIVYNS